MSLAAGTRLGSYEVVSLLGAGGMGEVYRARDTKLGRDVAIKILPDLFADDAERLARFAREARTLAALNHPNIAQIYGLEQTGTASALVMELVDGEDLSQRIARGVIPLDEALTIARQIADALEAAHEQGIIHRDLKPANIKVRDDGTVKVLDFGLAKGVDGGTASSGATITSPAMSMPGVILGTAAYMAPEQAKGKPIDKRADIWAFGCVLYEMVTATRPFRGEDVAETIASILKTEPEWAHVPAPVKPLLVKCLQKDPRRRLRDIGDADLDVFADRAPDARSVARAGRERVLMVAALAVTMAALALAIPALRHAREATPAPGLVVRFVIDGPPSATRVLSPEISPDGRTLAFAGFLPGSPVPSLWIRPFGAAAPERIPGTEGLAAASFWSPDGRSLAFPTLGGELKRLDLNNRSIRTITTLPNVNLDTISTFGGTWADDGTVLFSLGGTIYQMPADGGTPAVVPMAGLPPDGQQRYPVFLPASRRFVFLLQSSDPQMAGLYLAALDGTPARRLTPADSQAVYAATSPEAGQLLFMRGTTLMAQDFELAGWRLVGEPRSIVEGVMVSSSVLQSLARGQFSAASAILVYSSATQPPAQQLTWFDRSGKAIGTIGEPDRLMLPRLSPDNRRLAVARLDPRTENADIHIVDLERGAWSRLTFDPTDESFPVWSPDGRYVAYRSTRNGQFQLLRKLSNGVGQEEVLYESTSRTFPDDWTPDGRALIVGRMDPQTNNDLWILPLDGSRKLLPFVRTPGDDPRGRLSPDGRLLGYISNESGRMETYLQPFPAADGKWQLSQAGGNSPPQWRRDGKELYYSSRGTLWAVPVASLNPFATGPIQQLFAEPPIQQGSFPAASSDGRRFLYPVDLVQLSAAKYNVIVNWAADVKQ